MELGERHRRLLLHAVAAQRHGAVRGFPFADDQQVRNLAQRAFADLLRHRVALRGHLRTHEACPQLRVQAFRVVLELLGHGDDPHLHRRQPSGERAAEVLDENGGEALVGAERRAVDAIGRVLLTVRPGVDEVQARRHGEIQLHGGERLFAASHGAELDVDLRPVERRLARRVFVRHVHLREQVGDDALGAFPLRWRIDVLLLAFGVVRIPAREPQRVVLQAERAVGVVALRQHFAEDVLHLLFGAVDVRVVHAQAAHPRQPGDRAGRFPAVALAVFRQAQRQLAVAARPRGVDLVMVRTVHRLEHVALAHRLAARRLLGHLHRRVHALLVVRQVAGLREQFALGDVRRGDALVAGLELQLHGELLQLVADHRAGRQPQRQPAPDVVVQHEQVQLPAELLVIPLLRKLVSAHCGVEVGLVLERPRVDARHHHVLRVASPIGAGDAAQLEGVAGDVAGGVHVRAFAHVQKRAVAVEGEALQAVLGHQLGGVFALVRLLHFRQAGVGFGHRQVLPIEPLALLQNALHAPFKVGEVGLGEGFGQDEVVVEAVVHRRPETERGTRPHLQNRLRHHMRQAVADSVEALVRASCVCVHCSLFLLA